MGWRAGTTTLRRSQLYPPQSGTMTLANATAHWRVQYHKIHTVHFPSNYLTEQYRNAAGILLTSPCASSPYGKRDNPMIKNLPYNFKKSSMDT
jgi:hypothetical protein